MNIKSLLSNEVTQNELLNYYNANISYATLSNGINGFVFSYRGINNIIVNSSLSYYKKKKTIIHELAHIELSHLNQLNEFYSFYVDKVEDEADKYIKELVKMI